MKLKLVDDARHWRRMWSVRLAAAASVAAAVLLSAPDVALGVLNSMPAEMRSALPVWLPLLMFAAPTLTRLLKQEKKDPGNE